MQNTDDDTSLAIAELDSASFHSTSLASTELNSATQNKNLPEICNYVSPTKGKCEAKLTSYGKSTDRCINHQRCSDCDNKISKKGGKCIKCYQNTFGLTHNDNLRGTCSYVRPNNKGKCGSKVTFRGKSKDRCNDHQEEVR